MWSHRIELVFLVSLLTLSLSVTHAQEIAAANQDPRVDRWLAEAEQALVEPVLEELLERHILLAQYFLDKQDVDAAAWHTGQAEILALRYELEAPRLGVLRQRLAAYQPSLEQKELAAAEVARADTRQRLTELAAFYVLSSEAAKDVGDFASAMQRELTARQIMARYGLSDEAVRRLSTRFQLRRKPYLQPAIFKVYGTF